MRLTTRQIVIAGILGAVTIVLGATPLGFIPVPTPAGRATIMHIPAVLGGIIEGPVVGALIGLIFGFYSFTNAAVPMFADPLIAFIPRILIGIIAFWVYRLFSARGNLAAALAAIAGTFTNAVGVLGLSVIRGYIPSWEVAFGIFLVHTLPEAVLAVILVTVILGTLNRVIIR